MKACKKIARLCIRSVAWIALPLLHISHAQATVRLPALFGSNMVLQQRAGVNLWGWAEPGETIIITNSWSQDTVTARTTGEAKWKAVLHTPAAGRGYTLTIRGSSNTLVLHNVLIGEVWVCSGQSNMEYSAALGIQDAIDALPQAHNPDIRLFTVAKNAAETPQEDCSGNWQECDSASLRPFSAVGYFFARRLQQVLQIPVGIINISWSGTPAEVWMPADSVLQNPWLAAHAYSTRFPTNSLWPTLAGRAYNGMVAPAIPFTISGVAWYQGESNAGYPRAYSTLFTSLVHSWRKAWNSELPFYFVQIAPFSKYGQQDTPALVREQQVRCLQLPRTGMVVTTDLVENVERIHPSSKKEVGNRLGNWALAETYHQPGWAYQSPLYQKMEVRNNTIRIYFDPVPTGLMVKGDRLTEFEIAGTDRKFIPAMATIQGKTVVVSAKGLLRPVAVRFAFRNGPLPNLFSREGLPVSPFRTDDW